MYEEDNRIYVMFHIKTQYFVILNISFFYKLIWDERLIYWRVI